METLTHFESVLLPLLLSFFLLHLRDSPEFAALTNKNSVALFGEVGIHASGLSFRCICHPGNPIKTRSESGFCLLCLLLRVDQSSSLFPRCLLGHDIRQGVRQHVMKSSFVLLDSCGPSSSKCDLTLTTHVLPLRPSGSTTGLHLIRIPARTFCSTPCVTYFASIRHWMLVVSSTA